jgi:hypothetical protein
MWLVLSPGFLDSYWSAGFGKFIYVSALASHWLETVQMVRQSQRKMTNTTPTILSTLQTARKSTLSMHNYTPLVISRYDKNRQLLSLGLSKCEMAQATGN